MKIIESQRTQDSSSGNLITSKYGYFGHQKLLPVNFSNKHISEAQIQREADIEFRVKLNDEYNRLSSTKSQPRVINFNQSMNNAEAMKFLDADYSQIEKEEENLNMFWFVFEIYKIYI